MSKPHILVFGGSFNPPTLAHEAIIAVCLALPQFDEVWVMPSRTRADKEITVSDEHRLRLLHAVKREVFDDEKRLRISDVELRLPRPTRLHRTVGELAKIHPDADFWFAFGGDAYRSMSTWYAAADFMQDLRLVIFTEHEVPETQTGRALHLNIAAPFQEMSSSQVRAALASGTDASTWISAPVVAYVKQHRLYGAKELS